MITATYKIQLLGAVRNVVPRWHDPGMDIGGFWDIIGASRAGTVTGVPFHEVLTGRLASRREPEILESWVPHFDLGPSAKEMS